MSQEAFSPEDLSAPVKSFRLFALEQIIKDEGPAELLPVLRARLAEEDDQECRLLLAHAIQALEANGKPDSEAPSPAEPDAASLEHTYRESDSQARLTLIARWPAASLKTLAAAVPKLLALETNPIVASRLLRKCSRALAEEDLGSLVPSLDQTSSLVFRLTVLEVLLARAPRQLAQHLPSLLVSPDPGIISLAIRALAKIDPDEALNHLDALLQQEDRLKRYAGLQNCLFLPFEQIKPLLLNFLIAENDPALVQRAGWVFAINPDPQVPFHLFELSQQSQGEKARLVGEMLQLSLQLIKDSGILGDRFSTYMERLRAWTNRKAATRFVQECINRIDSAGGNLAPEFRQEVLSRLENSAVREVFQQALTWQIAPAARAGILALLSGSEGPGAPAGAPDPVMPGASAPPSGPNESPPVLAEAGFSPEGFGQLPLAEQIQRVSLCEPAQASLLKPLVDSLLPDEKSPRELRAALLRSATRLEMPGFTKAAEKAARQDDESLCTAGLEYLAFADAEQLLLLIGRYLQSTNARIKTTALRLLKRFDQRQAISSLKALLAEKDVEKKALALGAMIHFDFSLIRDLLTAFLLDQKDPHLLESGFCLFQANPDPENLYPLYSLEMSLSTPWRETARDIRRETAGLLIDSALTDEPTIKALESGFEERWRKAQAKKREAADRAKSAPPVPTTSELVVLTGTSLMTWLRERPRLVIGFGVLLGLLYLGLFSLLGSSQAIETAPQGEALMGLLLPITGTITEISPQRGYTLHGENGETFLVFPAHEGYPEPRVGEKVRAELIPFRKTADGVIQARIAGWENSTEKGK